MCSAHPDSNPLNTLNNSRAAFENKWTGSPGYFELCSYGSAIYLGFESLFQHSFYPKPTPSVQGDFLSCVTRLNSFCCVKTETHTWTNLRLWPVPSEFIQCSVHRAQTIWRNFACLGAHHFGVLSSCWLVPELYCGLTSWWHANRRRNNPRFSN